MAREILIPLDGSHFAEQALPCAMKLGQALPAKLVLFRAVSSPQNGRHSLSKVGCEKRPATGEQKARAHEYLQGMAYSLQGTVPGVGCVIREGDVAKILVDYAAEMDTQQIVMATHACNGHRGWTDSSVAERVVQTACTPVLLVHGREQAAGAALEPASCCRVLVALDGSDWAEQILPQLAATVGALGCELVLFQVSYSFLFDFSSRAADRMAAAYLERVAGRLEGQGIHVSTALRPGPVAETIVKYASANDIDLIALPTHGRSGIAGKILGSVAAQVLHWGSSPVWLVRAGGAHRAPEVGVGLSRVAGLGHA